MQCVIAQPGLCHEVKRRSVEEDACGGLNAQRPTPNAQRPRKAMLRFRSEFSPWTLGVGRWALGVEISAPRAAISRACDAIALLHSCPFVPIRGSKIRAR